MGGRLTVTSEQGVGSTFRFTLKFGLPSAANGTAAEAEGKLRGLSALVIDDNSTNRMILVELLSSWGMKCRGFGRPSEALENLRAQTEAGRADDVVLIDCHMDEMDGFEAAERIRTIAPATPVIMLTSSADANDAARRVRCGLAGHAVKPVRRSCLFGMIAAAVGRTDRPEACSQAEPDPGEEYPGQPLRILVAEDLPDNQFLIRTYLKRTPHELTFADNGKAALEAFRKESFDLILMDMRMPVMDGLSATRAIRELEGTHAATPIIALSANASTADIRLSFEAGCQTHLSKPISRSRLLAAIRDHVARVPAPEEASAAARRMRKPVYVPRSKH